MDQGKKPADTYKNYTFAIPRIPGLVDFHLNSILRFGTRHAIISSRIVPANGDDWARKEVNEKQLAAFYANAYGGEAGTCAERTDRRQALQAGSGILVFCGTKFIGVEEGDEGAKATFHVREPVETAPPLAPITPVVYRLDTHFCSDYNATVTWIGKPGQSTCTCLHGSCGAKENKEIAAIPAISCPLFTAQSHAADLARFNLLLIRNR